MGCTFAANLEIQFDFARILLFCLLLLILIMTKVGWGSAVVLATRYRLEVPFIESPWGAIFRTRPDRPWSPHSLLSSGYRVSLPAVKWPGGGGALTTRPRIWQSYKKGYCFHGLFYSGLFSNDEKFKFHYEKIRGRLNSGNNC